MSCFKVASVGCIGLFLLIPTPVVAGGAREDQIAAPSTPFVGRRLSREQAAGNIKPMGRIDNRIANRVQSRVPSRIDRSYSPAASSTAAFEAAQKSIKPRS